MLCKLKKSTLHPKSIEPIAKEKDAKENIYFWFDCTELSSTKFRCKLINPKFMGHNKLKVLWIDVSFWENGQMIVPVNELQTTVQTHNLFFRFPHFSSAFCFGSHHCLPLYLFVYFSFIASADKHIFHNVWILPLAQAFSLYSNVCLIFFLFLCFCVAFFRCFFSISFFVSFSLFLGLMRLFIFGFSTIN